jgi:hypothetical protein
VPWLVTSIQNPAVFDCIIMIGPSPGIATILIMVVFEESIDELVEALDSNYLGWCHYL